jgi:hypothetical protein
MLQEMANVNESNLPSNFTPQTHAAILNLASAYKIINALRMQQQEKVRMERLNVVGEDKRLTNFRR